MINDILDKYLNEGIFSKKPVGEGDTVEILKTVASNTEIDKRDREILKKYIGRKATVTWQNVKGLSVDIELDDGTAIELVPQKVLKKVKK